MPSFKKVFYAFAIASILYYSSCKEQTIIKTDSIPAIDNINTFFTDTNTVIAHNIIRDSFQTGGYNTKLDGYILAYYPALGSINNDPALGGTVASLAFQVRPPKNLLKFPSGGTLVTDSLILSLPYRGAFGDTSASNPQTFNVYRLTDTLPGSKRLYNNSEVTYSTLLGSATIDYNNMDSVTLFEGKRAPQLRIALSAAFAAELLALQDTLEYKNAETFKTWLKGFYITPADTNAGKAIGYFYLPGATMTYYFRNTIGTSTDTTQFVYKFDEDNCVHYNRITRNFNKANATAIPQYLNTNNPAGDSVLFAQGDCGAILDIKIPYIHRMPNVVINKAELEFTVVPSGYPLADTAFNNMVRLFPWKVSTADVETNLYFQSFSDLADGYLRPFTNGSITKKRYLINITGAIQKAVTLKDSTLHLHIKGFNTIANKYAFQASGRTVLGGSGASNDRLKLNLIYTKLK
jgi:hypothetical protein